MHQFTVNLGNTDPNQLLAKAKQMVVQVGMGMFSGDAQKGEFSVTTPAQVAFAYVITETQLQITILKKKGLIPNFMIEKKLREYLK